MQMRRAKYIIVYVAFYEYIIKHNTEKERKLFTSVLLFKQFTALKLKDKTVTSHQLL